LPVPLPPLPIQRRIAGILGALDDKIEVNRRINRTLEEMARTLYKHWFVDFGPFQAGEFVDSELGAVPAGWRVTKLKEVAKINPDSISKGNEPIHINYVNISSVDPGVIREVEPMPYSGAPSRAKRVVQHGDTIWSMVRPNRKSYCLIQNPIENLIVSTGFAVVRPKKVPYSFLYLALTTDSFVDYLTKRATGAAYPAVNTGDFKQAKVLVPPQQIGEQFEAIVRPWFSLQGRLQRENRVLTETRDYLLPKLLSGEVEVPAAEAVVEGRPAGSEVAGYVQPALFRSGKEAGCYNASCWGIVNDYGNN